MKYLILNLFDLIRPLLIAILFISFQSNAQQTDSKESDSTVDSLYEKGNENVNSCTPKSHLKCIYITFTEVYKDGSEGKPTRHWWRMSYIGRACTDEYGTTFGKIFEGVFIVPHYLGVGIGNGLGYVVFLVRSSQEKIEARRLKRKLIKSKRELINS